MPEPAGSFLAANIAPPERLAQIPQHQILLALQLERYLLQSAQISLVVTVFD